MISTDAAEDLVAMRQKLDLTFPALMDAGSRTIRSYGILNTEDGEIPHPAALIIDRKGIVRYVRIDEDYKKRPSNEELLQVLRKLPESES